MFRLNCRLNRTDAKAAMKEIPSDELSRLQPIFEAARLCLDVVRSHDSPLDRRHARRPDGMVRPSNPGLALGPVDGDQLHGNSHNSRNRHRICRNLAEQADA